MQEVLKEYKTKLRKRCGTVTEGADNQGRSPINRIFTDLYITEGQIEEVDTQHEVTQLEKASKIKIVQDIPISWHRIFKTLPDQHGAIRVVLTNGIAGVGKTFLVQNFTVDWAESLENQDISVVFLFSLRELDIIRDEQHSLVSLLHVFQPTLQKFPAEQLTVQSRLSLDFNNNQLVSDVSQKS